MCHSSYMCILSSIVEITAIFLVWHLNMWVHDQICYPSKLIEIVCMCEEMICAKMKPGTGWHFIQESVYPQFCSTHASYDCSLADLGVCETSLWVSDRVHFRHQMGPWTCGVARRAWWSEERVGCPLLPLGSLSHLSIMPLHSNIWKSNQNRRGGREREREEETKIWPAFLGC